MERKHPIGSPVLISFIKIKSHIKNRWKWVLKFRDLDLKGCPGDVVKRLKVGRTRERVLITGGDMERET